MLQRRRVLCRRAGVAGPQGDARRDRAEGRAVRAARRGDRPPARASSFRTAILFFHNVFSLSRPATFDLGRYPVGRRRDRAPFAKPGIVKVYCHLHSQMSALMRVFDHPWFTIPERRRRVRHRRCAGRRAHAGRVARAHRRAPRQVTIRAGATTDVPSRCQFWSHDRVTRRAACPPRLVTRALVASFLTVGAGPRRRVRRAQHRRPRRVRHSVADNLASAQQMFSGVEARRQQDMPGHGRDARGEPDAEGRARYVAHRTKGARPRRTDELLATVQREGDKIADRSLRGCAGDYGSRRAHHRERRASARRRGRVARRLVAPRDAQATRPRRHRQRRPRIPRVVASARTARRADRVAATRHGARRRVRERPRAAVAR